jgi:hypothetical protein
MALFFDVALLVGDRVFGICQSRLQGSREWRPEPKIRPKTLGR